ncbi:hypothetical protein FOA52_012675 [Chlamydomonas sp. UWO 241]|nr:hypothetical protein FOA52_012675 [Chlamydomonas sp. UWO 241]
MSRQTSQYTGVSWDKVMSAWRAGRGRGERRYASEEDAARAYDRAAVQAYGPGAKRNLKEEAAAAQSSGDQAATSASERVACIAAAEAAAAVAAARFVGETYEGMDGQPSPGVQNPQGNPGGQPSAAASIGERRRLVPASFEAQPRGARPDACSARQTAPCRRRHRRLLLAVIAIHTHGATTVTRTYTPSSLRLLSRPPPLPLPPLPLPPVRPLPLPASGISSQPAPLRARCFCELTPCLPASLCSERRPGRCPHNPQHCEVAQHQVAECVSVAAMPPVAAQLELVAGCNAVAG